MHNEEGILYRVCLAEMVWYGDSTLHFSDVNENKGNLRIEKLEVQSKVTLPTK